MPSKHQHLRTLAEEEVKHLLRTLPKELRDRAAAVPVVCDGRSTAELEEEDLGDTLGLFVGENMLELGRGSALPAQIILYLQNLWLEAEEDEDTFRREVRTTLLHELGHFLGLEETDLDERGL